MRRNAVNPENIIEISGARKVVVGLVASFALTGASTSCTPNQISMSAVYCEQNEAVSGTPVQQCLGELATAYSNSQNAGIAIDPGVHEINQTKAPSDPGLARLRQCESGNRYTITNKTGKYMGAYQFDQKTWNSVATSEPALVTYNNVKPHHAPPVVQDAAARALFEDRGAKPWPECGKRI